MGSDGGMDLGRGGMRAQWDLTEMSCSLPQGHPPFPEVAEVRLHSVLKCETLSSDPSTHIKSRHDLEG